MAEEYHSVVVVGAGVSGLYAGHLLKQRYPDLLVLEAQDRVGGRIKQASLLCCWCCCRGGQSAPTEWRMAGGCRCSMGGLRCSPGGSM